MKYFLDDLYGWIVARVVLGLSNAFAWFDKRVIDGAVNGVAWLTSNVLGWAVDRSESGRAPNYALGIFAGIVVIAAAVLAAGVPGITR